MKIVSGYFVYRVYVTYKAHFGSAYADVSKYNFALFKPPYDRFVETRGKHYYDKIAKRLQTEEKVTRLFIAAFVHDSQIWIGDIADSLSKYIKLMDERDDRINNMPYIFFRDCKCLMEEGMKFDNTLGSFVFDKVLDDSVTIETFIILRKILKFRVDNNTSYDYIYSVKYEKYELLFKVGDIQKYKSILEEAIMSLRE